MSVDTEEWPRREFPENTYALRDRISLVIRQSVLDDIRSHGEAMKEVEVCGVLVGRGYQDRHGPFVHIEGSIRGNHAGSQVAQVTFTDETWAHINKIMDSAWPTHRIVGWYHTHPGFGVFLSDMDLFIHENFFAASEQIALVYDPISGLEGLFVWNNGKTTRSRFLIEQDNAESLLDHAKAGNIGSSSLVPTGSVAGSASRGLSNKVERLKGRQRLLITSQAILFAVALLWPIGAMWLLTESQIRPDTSEGITPPNATVLPTTSVESSGPKAPPSRDTQGAPSIVPHGGHEEPSRRSEAVEEEVESEQWSDRGAVSDSQASATIADGSAGSIGIGDGAEDQTGSGKVSEPEPSLAAPDDSEVPIETEDSGARAQGGS